MTSDPPLVPVMLSSSAAIPYHLLLRLEFTAPVLVPPVFGRHATWLSRLGPALARARLAHGPVLVRITLSVPLGTNGPPPQSEEPEEGFAAEVCAILAWRGLAATVNGVSIRESAEPREGLSVEVAIYGRPR